ncbi:hypothetical protein AB3S75_005006 [Citrus x aurantiifolia]
MIDESGEVFHHQFKHVFLNLSRPSPKSQDKTLPYKTQTFSLSEETKDFNLTSAAASNVGSILS